MAMRASGMARSTEYSAPQASYSSTTVTPSARTMSPTARCRRVGGRGAQLRRPRHSCRDASRRVPACRSGTKSSFALVFFDDVCPMNLVGLENPFNKKQPKILLEVFLFLFLFFGRVFSTSATPAQNCGAKKEKHL